MSAKKEVYLAESSEMSDAEHLVETTPVEATPSSANTSEAADNKRPAGEGQRKPLVTDQVKSWFAACARCSFFLVGYQLEYNGVQSSQAVAENQAGWLSLGWDQTVCKLLRKSYGSQLDVDCFHYEGVCPECRRQFVYRTVEGESAGQFQIELRPQTGR